MEQQGFQRITCTGCQSDVHRLAGECVSSIGRGRQDKMKVKVKEKKCLHICYSVEFRLLRV